jgi:LacI family transcriptional regulator
VGVLHELDRMGKRAGKALAVVGCDNVVAAEHTNPPLTTLSAGADRLGTIASETLLARLNETAENEKPTVQYFAVPDLVVRESSVGAPRRNHAIANTRHGDGEEPIAEGRRL